MNDQMALLPDARRDDRPAGEDRPPRTGPASWELDDHTRHVGRQGLAAARAALQQACAARQAA
jgi:hypothetical protein